MTQDRVMLLIDADNVSVDVMEQAVRLLLNQHGGLHVRRAYCTAEGALKNQAVFKRLGIKPMVNLATGKNSTDIALAVDAMDLVLAERPDVMVIASSDSDFAPLVQRLREKGCVVRGIGQQGKTGNETQEVYDDFTVLEHRKAPGATARSRDARDGGKGGSSSNAGDSGDSGDAPIRPVRKTAARKTPAKRAAAKKAPAAKKAAAKKAAAKAAPRRPAARKSAAAAVAAEPQNAAPQEPAEAGVLQSQPQPSRAEAPAARPSAPAARRAGGGSASTQGRAPASEQAVLDCLPELSSGQSLPLNVAVQRLREARLLGKNSSSLKLFAQLSERFELVPADKPTQVRWRR